MTRNEEERRIARRRVLLIAGGFIYLLICAGFPPLLIGIPIALGLRSARKHNQKTYAAQQRRESQINRRGYGGREKWRQTHD